MYALQEVRGIVAYMKEEYKIKKKVCDNCGKDLHTVIVDIGQTFYCEDTDKVFCSYGCMRKCKERKPQKIYSEQLAIKFLRGMGFIPKRCTKKGYPNFKLSHNVYVEVKTPGTGLNINQIKKFNELLQKDALISIFYVCEGNITSFVLEEGFAECQI